MSANDYIASVKERNRKLWAASKIAMMPDSLEWQLRAAFEAGRRSGEKATMAKKSVFEEKFGTPLK